MNADMKPLRLSETFTEQIRREGAAAYPNECCGVIYGVEKGGERVKAANLRGENYFALGGKQSHEMNRDGVGSIGSAKQAGHGRFVAWVSAAQQLPRFRNLRRRHGVQKIPGRAQTGARAIIHPQNLPLGVALDE